MRAWVRAWALCVGVAWAGVAPAAPGRDASAQYKLAVQLHDSGEYDQALASIADGLAIAPKDLPLLGLKGTLLLELRDYAGALAAYQAYLDAGAKGANRREAQKIVSNLRAVESTFLDITANGPAAIYLDTRTRGVFCTAAPSCHKPVLPGDYKVIAERAGFERWTGHISVENAQTAKLAITLVESSSPLTVRSAPPGARVTVDGAATVPATVAPGKHQVVVSLAGYVEARLEATAHEGKPIELDVALTQLALIRVEPAAATLVLDDKPAAVKNGRIAIPPGSHVLVARAQGFREQRIEIPADRTAEYRVEVELAHIEADAKPAPQPVSSTRELIGSGMKAVGVVGLGAGFLLDVNEQADRSSTTPGTVLIAASGAAMVAGVILSLTAPSERRPQAARILPTLGDSRVGLAVAGRF